MFEIKTHTFNFFLSSHCKVLSKHMLDFNVFKNIFHGAIIAGYHTIHVLLSALFLVVSM